MEIDAIKVLSFVLVFVPGYIFIHTLDYHLQKGEKSQFEKTVQAVLASTVLWTLFVVIQFQPWNDEKQSIINLLVLSVKNPSNKYVMPLLLDKIQSGLLLFLLLCVYSFLLSTAYALLRKTQRVGNIVHKITKRDYFKEVALRFYSEGLNKVAVVNLKSGKRYIGYLIGAPDQVDDHKIILYKPQIYENSTYIKLGVDRLLIDTEEVEILELMKGSAENGRRNSRARRRFFARKSD